MEKYPQIWEQMMALNGIEWGISWDTTWMGDLIATTMGILEEISPTEIGIQSHKNISTLLNAGLEDYIPLNSQVIFRVYGIDVLFPLVGWLIEGFLQKPL